MPVVLVTGVPGSGKTTISRMLAGELGADVLEVNEYAIRERLVLGADRERGVLVLDVEGVREALRRDLREKSGWSVVSTAYPEAVPPEFVRLVVVLRCNPEVLAERLLSRGYPKAKVIENVEAEIVDYCGQSAREHVGSELVLELDTSTGKPEDVVRVILGALRGEMTRTPPLSWPLGPLTVQRLRAEDP